MNKVKSTVLITVAIFNLGKIRAKSLGLSFSAYIEQLIRKDLEG
ncbi:hypothetical protein [Neobacillus niacini]|nr:hypothetical protein [Neobacillus niacini]